VILALCQGADYILMDEPFAGNDIFNREDFYKVLLGILEPTETVILSTHLLTEINSFISRAVLLWDGQIVGDVSALELDEQGLTVWEYVKKKYHYIPDRVSSTLGELTGEEEGIPYQPSSDGPQLSVTGQPSTIYYHGDLMSADDHITYAGSKKVGQEIVRGVIMAWRRGEDGTFSPVISTSLPDPSPIYSRSITSILQGDTLYTLTYAGGGDCSHIFVAVYTPQGCCYSASLTLSQYFDSSDNHSITLTGLRLECVPTS